MEQVRWKYVPQSCKPVGDHKVYGTLLRDQSGNMGWHLVQWTKQAKPVWEYWFAKDEFYEIVRGDDGWVGHGHYKIGGKVEVDPPKAEAIREIVRKFERLYPTAIRSRRCASPSRREPS
jgi:hypothetical protein